MKTKNQAAGGGKKPPAKKEDYSPEPPKRFCKLSLKTVRGKWELIGYFALWEMAAEASVAIRKKHPQFVTESIKIVVLQ